jgi:hypothetical protein
MSGAALPVATLGDVLLYYWQQLFEWLFLLLGCHPLKIFVNSEVAL